MPEVITERGEHFDGGSIVRFCVPDQHDAWWHDQAGRWGRSYGNELWEFADNGLMRRREASINDVAIEERDRRFVGSSGQTDELPLR